jgi:tetratricopeptide (TPR) repeat protein
MIPAFLRKHLIILTALIVLASATGQGQSPAQVYDQANQLYQQNKFAEARDAYEKIVQNGYAGGEVYYNLGNAYYKLGDAGRAILNYERALRFMPGDDDLTHNLQIANLVITDKIEPTPRLFLWDYWNGIKGAFSVTGLTWIVYGLFVLFIGSICLIILSRTYAIRRFGVLGTGGSALLLIFFVIVFIGKVGDVTSNDTAIVTAKITTIKNSPDEKSTDAFVLHNGVKVQITDSVNKWVKIRLADGKVGWMEKSDGEVI